MIDRFDLLRDFIKESGWQAATRVPLAADASSRSYDRLIDEQSGKTAILMNAPIDIESNIVTFKQVTETLRGYGLSAPEVYHTDAINGFLLIEDLGDDLFKRICGHTPEMEWQLYEAAIDVLAELHTHNAPLELPRYDAQTYLREARLLTDWYLPAATGALGPAALPEEYDRLINEACALLPTDGLVLVQRDYHAENLLWLPQRSGIKRVGLLDYQDALAGHPAYDLVSLLEDARRDTSPELQAAMITRYLAAKGVDEKGFIMSYNILGAQRNLKIIGIFTRLYLRDGKATYLDLIPRVWAHLMRDLMHPALAGLQSWVKQNLPEPNATTLNKIRDARDES